MCFAAPDVCLTPPLAVPIPYPNMAMPPNGTSFVPHVFTVTGNAHNQGTIIPMSVGDAPGVIGGVASGTVMDQCSYILCCNKVLTGGMPTPRLTSVTLQNSCNAVGAVVVPSQLKVLLLAP